MVAASSPLFQFLIPYDDLLAIHGSIALGDKWRIVDFADQCSAANALLKGLLTRELGWFLGPGPDI